MIVVDRAKLKFLTNGRTIQVDVNREYRKGRSYAVGASHRKTVCRALIVDVFQLNDETWRLTIKQMSGDQVRLLSRAGAGGYVYAPVEANPDDPDVLRGGLTEEPEALSDEQVRDLTRYSAARAHNQRTAPLTDWTERVLAELDEQLRTAPSRDARDKLRVARHHLRRIDRAS